MMKQPKPLSDGELQSAFSWAEVSRMGLSIDSAKRLLATIEARDREIAELKEARRYFRARVFGLARSTRSDHTTACTIWGDNGQGGTEENFKEPLPCNCGALINYSNKQRDSAKALIVRLVETLKNYGVHAENCEENRIRSSEKPTCNCGLFILLSPEVLAVMEKRK